MAAPQLSVRSARARDLAHRLAAAERRTVVQVVEQALELYARIGAPENSYELAADFYARLARDASADIDIDSVIRAAREPHEGPEL